MHNVSMHVRGGQVGPHVHAQVPAGHVGWHDVSSQVYPPHVSHVPAHDSGHINRMDIHILKLFMTLQNS